MDERQERRPRRAFSPEFEAQTVELVRSSGKSIPAVARDLDLTESALREWVRQADVDDGRREVLTTDEPGDLSRLRWEVRTRREEREILKKAPSTRAWTSAGGVGKRASARPLGSVGDCFDNSMAESFFARSSASSSTEPTFRNRSEAKLAVFDFTEGFYNTTRRLSCLGNVSPLRFEDNHSAA